MSKTLKKTKIGIIGVGYVGLPLAILWGKTQISPVIAFDIDKKRIEELKKGQDRKGEISKEEFEKSKVIFSSDPEILKKANFFVVTVPTPLNQFKEPDLSFLESACKTIGEKISPKAIVVIESTVYPGTTEGFCKEILERYSKLKAGKDFFLGYSPERINPGLTLFTLENITKIISAQDKKTLKKMREIYSLICKSLYEAPEIKVAEAAKLMENIQRDVNIALVNELSIFLKKLGISAREVIKAASTKWNFHFYKPGLVGGSCLPKDPYYLIFKTKKELKEIPSLVMKGREINEKMPSVVFELIMEGLKEGKKQKNPFKILILGLSYKENVRDIQNSKIKEVIGLLQKKKAKIWGFDPFLKGKEEIPGLKIHLLRNLRTFLRFDVIFLNVLHQKMEFSFKKIKKISTPPPIIIDPRGYLDFPKDKEIIYKSF